MAACVAELAEKSQAAQYVLIGRVLQILDPEHKLAPAPPPSDPRADPLFGTMPTDPEAYQRPPPGPSPPE